MLASGDLLLERVNSPAIESSVQRGGKCALTANRLCSSIFYPCEGME